VKLSAPSYYFNKFLGFCVRSIIDRTSFAVMRRLGVERAASLDDHFAIFRFGLRRRQSFSIIR